MGYYELRFTRLDNYGLLEPEVVFDRKALIVSRKMEGIQYLLRDLDYEEFGKASFVRRGLKESREKGEWYEMQFNSSLIDYDGASTVRFRETYGPSPLCLMHIDDVESLLKSWEKWTAGEFRTRKSRIYLIPKDKIRFRPRSEWP